MDRAAIVTGGSRGIGYAIAKALVEADYRVAISGRTATTLGRAVAQLNANRAPPCVTGIVCDVRGYADCQRLIAETVGAFGRLDLLVNNAGIGDFAPVADLSPDRWDAVIETNLSGVFYCTREAIPHLKKAGGGWIINIGSLAGKNAFTGGAAYNASKFGLIGFTEALMLDVRYDDIRASCIMPGSVATEFAGRDAGAEDWRIAPEDVAQAVMNLLAFPARSMPSRVELRPSKPPRR
jgi:NAD(P)-dependent dehydrogenase (short-subunit alcohol dehydrogenase family)